MILVTTAYLRPYIVQNRRAFLVTSQFGIQQVAHSLSNKCMSTVFTLIVVKQM